MHTSVGCNGVDLTELTFNECMAVIRQADWPKTLHFIRDPAAADRDQAVLEGWTKMGAVGSAPRKVGALSACPVPALPLLAPPRPSCCLLSSPLHVPPSVLVSRT